MATTAVRQETDRSVVLFNVSWEEYEKFLKAFGDRGSPRLTYDRGTLEIMSPGPEHEEAHLVLANVVSVVAEELGIDFRPAGHTTFRRPGLKRGFEADASFYLGHSLEARNVAEIDPVQGRPPDLVIEIDVTNPSLKKLPVYAAMGVPAAWRYADGQVQINVLEGKRYRAAERSLALPMVSAENLTRWLAESRDQSRLAWLGSLRTWVRARDAS